MSFSNYWRDFKRSTGASGPLWMQRCFWQYQYEQGRISLDERNRQLDEIDVLTDTE